MFTEATAGEIRAVARAFGMEPAALLAVAEIESGGTVFALIDGRREPVIRFEGHYFDRRLSGEARTIARTAGLASPNAGAVANPASQAARWRMLERAATIDRKAAYESVSWGLGQVMGAHWAWLGFADVDALVADARAGTAGQTRLMARYIENAGLKDALAACDWERFAHSYNGPGYRKNAYHTKLAAAYRRHAAEGGGQVSAPAAEPPLRQGTAGDRVLMLQRKLCALGYPLAVDGIFGKGTDKALRAFQRDHGLAVDGIAGPLTRAAIEAALPLRGAWWRPLLNWLKRRFAI